MKDEKISRKCELTDKLYKDLLTSTQVFQFLKEIIKKYNNVINYAIPSVEISKHYLESFKKEK
jgi:hypothetical protein